MKVNTSLFNTYNNNYNYKVYPTEAIKKDRNVKTKSELSVKKKSKTGYVINEPNANSVYMGLGTCLDVSC